MPKMSARPPAPARPLVKRKKRRPIDERLLPVAAAHAGMAALIGGATVEHALDRAQPLAAGIPEARAWLAPFLGNAVRHRAQLAWWCDRIGLEGADGGLPDAAAMTAVALVLLAEGGAVHVAAAMAQHGNPVDAAALSRLGKTFHPDQPEAVARNLPQDLLDALRVRLGEDWSRELAALDRPTGLDLRVNPLRIDRDTAAVVLTRSGIAAVPTAHARHGLRTEGRPPLARTEAFRDGWFEVQDEASQIAAALVDARPGQRVIDLCAGAGGKTLALAAAMANKGSITACDVDARRLKDAVARLRRAGVHNVQTRLLDPEGDRWLKRQRGGFDRVLVDAPCTGTGTWRRKPEQKWRWHADMVAGIAVVQADLLDRGARLVRPGGRLVYAVCSILGAECEERVDAFLERTPGFVRVPVDTIWASLLDGDCPVAGPDLLLTPMRHGTDGFFLAVLERTP